MTNLNSVVDPEVVTLALSFIAYQGTMKNITKQEDLKNIIKSCLDDFKPYIGNFEIQWGPFIYKYLFAADIMLFIVKDNANPPNYFVVIRGGNPNPLCFTQAILIFDIFSTVEWSKVPQQGIIKNKSVPHPPPLKGRETRKIYAGLNRALDILINKIDTSGAPKIFQFLENIARSGSPIYITGHSFGGVLASTLALYLKDTLPELLKPEIYIYSYGAPSAGNKDFAAYSDNNLGVNCKSITNKLDIAYSMLNKDLVDLNNLYKPNIPKLARKMFFLLLNIAIKGKKFQHIRPMFILSHIVDFGLNIKKNGYLAQLYYQHHIPYLAYIKQNQMSDEFISLLDSLDLIKDFKQKEEALGYPKKDLKHYLNLLLVSPEN